MPRPRECVPELLRLLRHFPALAILGPRQIGKSTLARQAFSGFAVFDLEDPRDFDRIRADALLVLSENRRLVIDEVQRMPDLFPLLRSFLDRHSRHRVVLLGSASPALVHGISESLSGRIALFDLGPISIREHRAADLWVRGGFPRIHWSRPRARPEDWFPAYLRTTLEQDLPQLGYTVSATRLRTLLTMLAHGQGGLTNLSDLGRSLGLNYHTVEHMLDLLEGVYLIRRLRPWYANVGKRLVKAPKIYLRDTGLLHSLLGIPFARRALMAHPKAGASWETFCIEQVLVAARMRDPSTEAYFYRTHAGAEVDLVLSTGGRILPIEIKLGLGPPDLRGLSSSMGDLGAKQAWVIGAGTGLVEIRRGVHMGGLDDVIEAICPRRRKGA